MKFEITFKNSEDCKEEYRRFLDYIKKGVDRGCVTEFRVYKDAKKAKDAEVIVEVSEGVAEVTKCPSTINVEIIDHDNI